MEKQLNVPGKYRRLNPAVQYCLKVINIDGGRKVNIEGTYKWPIKLLFEDRFGYKYWCEYVCPTEFQDKFINGKKTVFRVVKQETQCDQIAPVDEEQEVEKVPILSMITKLSEDNLFRVSLDYSVRLAEAELTGRIDAQTEDELQRILDRSDKIAQYLLDRIANMLTDETAL